MLYFSTASRLLPASGICFQSLLLILFISLHIFRVKAKVYRLTELSLVCKIATQFSRWLLNPYLEVCLLSHSEAIKHVEYIHQLTIIPRFGNNKGRRNSPPR